MSTNRRTFINSLTTIGATAYAQRIIEAADITSASTPTGPSQNAKSPALNREILFSCKYGMIKGQNLEKRLEISREAGFDGVDFEEDGFLLFFSGLVTGGVGTPRACFNTSIC